MSSIPNNALTAVFAKSIARSIASSLNRHPKNDGIRRFSLKAASTPKRDLLTAFFVG